MKLILSIIVQWLLNALKHKCLEFLNIWTVFIEFLTCAEKSEIIKINQDLFWELEALCDRNLNICSGNQSQKEYFPLLNNNMQTAEETKLSLALFIA